MKILIFGDIHGRTFWKKPLEDHFDKVDKVVFLGDYFDPYEDEGIEYEFEDMVSNFNEIIKLKADNPDKVVLLLGNHDFHYKNDLFCEIAQSTRFSHWHHRAYEKLFNDNSKYFELCHIEYVNKKRVIFTHAGITEFWLNYCDIKDDEHLDATINNLEMSNEGVGKLAVIGKCRSWLGEKTGSPLWCDIEEFISDKGLGEDTYQIFGHTRLKKGASISMKGFSCLDSQTAFILNNKCKLKAVKNEKVKANKKQPVEQDTEDAKS